MRNMNNFMFVVNTVELPEVDSLILCKMGFGSPLIILNEARQSFYRYRGNNGIICPFQKGTATRGNLASITIFIMKLFTLYYSLRFLFLQSHLPD